MNISELPQDIKELALLRQKEGKLDKFTDDLDDAFDWSETIEGHYYWKYWYDKQYGKVKPKNHEDAIAIIDAKIAYMQSVDAEMFYLTIGVLKDLIISIKENK
jgi:hypothetical protein